MKTCEETQKEYARDLIELKDPYLQYEYLIELSGTFPRMSQAERESAWVVEGCQSHVWIHFDSHGSVLQFSADSDTMIIRGVLAIIVDVYSGHPVAEILATPFHVLEDAGALGLLSDERQGGIKAIMRDIRLHAESAH